jgi:hypothetical protein
MTVIEWVKMLITLHISPNKPPGTYQRIAKFRRLFFAVTDLC